MEREKYFEATEFENLKELIYDAVQKYKEQTAFVIKHKKDTQISYEKEDISIHLLPDDTVDSGLLFG